VSEWCREGLAGVLVLHVLAQHELGEDVLDRAGFERDAQAPSGERGRYAYADDRQVGVVLRGALVFE
jgi:hypothetical protein